MWQRPRPEEGDQHERGGVRRHPALARRRSRRAACCSTCRSSAASRSVTVEKPVHGGELAAIAKAQGVRSNRATRSCVYSGREAWQAANRDWSGYAPPSPGLHATLPAVRARQRRRRAGVGPDGRRAERVRRAVDDARRDLLVRHRARRQRAAAAAAQRRARRRVGTSSCSRFAPLCVVGGTGSPINRSRCSRSTDAFTWPWTHSPISCDTCVSSSGVARSARPPRLGWRCHPDRDDRFCHADAGRNDWDSCRRALAAWIGEPKWCHLAPGVVFPNAPRDAASH